MDCRYLELSLSQLEDFKKGLEDGKLWSNIYTLLKEPDLLCGIIRLLENSNENDESEEHLSQAIYSTTSMFIAKISVNDKYRAYEIVKLIRNEISDIILKYNELFLDFKHSKNNHLTGKEIKIITDSIALETEESADITWNEENDERLNATTDLYIVATIKPDIIDNEDSLIDSVLDEINDIDLGEYKEILIKRAELHAKLTIDDFKEHKDAVVVSMADYLTGAAEAIKIIKENKTGK